VAYKPTVLVVDDDPSECLITATYLRGLGCRVFTAHDGCAALENATALLPDAIVMDLELPHLDGCEAIRRLNERRPTRNVPVIALAESGDSRPKAFEAGCTAYLIKPCAPAILWAQISALLERAEPRPALR